MGAQPSTNHYADEDEESQSLLGRSAASFAAQLGFEQRPKTRLERCLGCLPELSYTTRVLGFLFCFLVGTLLSAMSVTSFGSVLLGNPLPFAFKYTAGNVLSLCSYTFLVGPQRQCAGMFAPERRLTTVCYLGSLAATLGCVFQLRNRALTIVCIVIQCLAMVSYALSYLPMGQGAGWRLGRRLLGV